MPNFSTSDQPRRTGIRIDAMHHDVAVRRQDGTVLTACGTTFLPLPDDPDNPRPGLHVARCPVCAAIQIIAATPIEYQQPSLF